MKQLSNNIPLDSLVILYLTLIEPYFHYCDTIWGNCEQELLNKLQINTTKQSCQDCHKNPLLQCQSLNNIEKVTVVECETVSGLQNTCSHVQSRQ